MKRTLLTMLSLMLVLFSFSQVKKEDPFKGEKKSSEQIEQPKVDTVKVRISLYATSGENQFIAWQDGYLVSSTKFEQATKVKDQNQLKSLAVNNDGTLGFFLVGYRFYDKKFKEINAEDVANIKELNWK